MVRGRANQGRSGARLFDARLASTVLILPAGLISGDLDLAPVPESQARLAWLVADFPVWSQPRSA